MVQVGDFTKEKCIPVTFPRRRLPVEKIFDFDAPEIRGGIIVKENLLCPMCKTIEAVYERHWIGGPGWVLHLVCERCHYWERSVK